VKRDMDLVRSILTALAEAPFTGDGIPLRHADHTPEEITYHIIIMHEAGLIHAVPPSVDESFEWNPVYVTWSGHEFLEAAKDDTRWNNAKSYMKEKGAPMVFDVLKSLLVSYAKQAVLGPSDAG
jgi:hypothetical protein